MSSTIWSKLSMALANSRKTGKKASFPHNRRCFDCEIAPCFFSPPGRSPRQRDEVSRVDILANDPPIGPPF
ncbi:hypothetical protein, partial [Agrobacterium tumefaciens]|uniref:hypothetical protein n=1 Tax=Agrobacterium tumefaciens TaxID=358 RepID=UPI001BADABD8